MHVMYFGSKTRENVFLRNNTVLIDVYSFLNVYIRCMDVWKKINVKTQGNRQLLFLIIKGSFLIIQDCSFLQRSELKIHSPGRIP